MGAVVSGEMLAGRIPVKETAMKGGKSHGNEQRVWRICAAGVHDDFRANPSWLYRGGGAPDHPSHQRIKHQYRDGLG